MTNLFKKVFTKGTIIGSALCLVFVISLLSSCDPTITSSGLPVNYTGYAYDECSNTLYYIENYAQSNVAMVILPSEKSMSLDTKGQFIHKMNTCKKEK